MPETPRIWPAIFSIFLFWLLASGVALISRAPWLVISVIAVSFLASASVINSYLNSVRDSAVMRKLSELPNVPDSSRAYRLLADITLSGSEKKSFSIKASETIKEELKIEKFVICFRENDRYLPRIFFGLNKNDLNAPPVHKLSSDLRNGIQNGALSTSDIDTSLICRHGQFGELSSPVAFAYSWGRTRSVFTVVEDKHGYFSEIVKDTEFNRIFWPGLEAGLKSNLKFQDKTQEIKQATLQLEHAQKNINDLNRELRGKLLDLQAFVKVSNDLYSLFNEEQMFVTLKKTVCAQIGANFAEILVPSGDGGFTIQTFGGIADEALGSLRLNAESEFCTMLARSSKPILLPIVGSGFKQDEPFLDAALKQGFQLASAIRTGGQPSCILLVGHKADNSQYASYDIDFLYMIGNIASLALDNIHQYSTIEKLSYTDSMTGVYNYRYFYKRLNEEILRAKRYERELSLVILDIDNFKSFNDNFGHQAGDLVLKQLSELITKTIRSIDVVSRYGGEEFCVIMPDTGFENCEVFIERLRSQIADFRFESEMFPKGNSISVSVGGAVYPQHAPMPDRLIYCADMALLKAKSLGRNKAIMFEADLALGSNSTEGGFNESCQESLL